MIIITIVLHIFATNFIGEVLGVKSAAIEFGIDGKRRSLHIKDSMELEIEGLIGGDENQESRIVNQAFSAVPGSDLVVARTSKYRYDDHGMNGIILVRTGSIVDLATHLNLLIFNRLRRRIIDWNTNREWHKI